MFLLPMQVSDSQILRHSAQTHLYRNGYLQAYLGADTRRVSEADVCEWYGLLLGILI